MTTQPIGIGLVGAGMIGRLFLKHLAIDPRARVAAVHQRSGDTAAEALTDAGLDAALFQPSFDAMLADDAVDAVFLCGPNASHGPMSIAALEAGKHVFCEKPIATAVADYARQLRLAAERPDLITLVDYILHFHPFEQRLVQMVEAGSFGTVTQIQVNYRHPVNIAGAKAWKLSRREMGDAIGMGVIHSLYVMLAAMAPQAKPVRVYATSMPAQVRGFEPEPIWNIQITFDNGACGFCFGNIDSSNGYDALHSVYGTAGALVHDSLADPPQKVRYWSAATDGRWIPPLDRARCEALGVPDLTWEDGFPTPDSGDVMDHLTSSAAGHFVECVRTGNASPLSFANTRTVTDVGWAAQVSARTGQPVDLPIDLDEAARLLDR